MTRKLVVALALAAAGVILYRFADKLLEDLY
jgi:hypothetical protein